MPFHLHLNSFYSNINTLVIVIKGFVTTINRGDERYFVVKMQYCCYEIAAQFILVFLNVFSLLQSI